MREFIVATLVLLWIPCSPAQPPPADWKPVRDAHGACQISVPPDWVSLEQASGAAVLRDASTAVAVVTSQPGQAFKPLSESLQRLLGIARSRMFENSAKRIFYQDKVSRNPDDPNALSASVPSKAGTCSCRITALPLVPVETAKTIALSLVASGEEEGDKPRLRSAMKR